MSIPGRFARFVRDNKTRIKHIGIGHAIYDTASWLFDNPLYIAMIAIYGPLRGGAIMTFFSLLICLVTLFVYERMQIEWTGVDVIDDLRERGLRHADRISCRERHKTLRELSSRVFFFIPTKIFVFAMWLLQKYGDIAGFFIFSILEDAFYTTAYLRHGRFDGLKTKDYLVFLSSVLFSNGYWILRNWGLITVFLLVWRFSLHVLHAI
jgi:hypothetical protein